MRDANKGDNMQDNNQFYIIKKRAVPEVLLNVIAAKHLLESNKDMTVQEATEAVGISRSSFYKYKDDIFHFHEKGGGRNITFMIQMIDQPGLLSSVLNQIASFGANILTINQAIPVGGIALVMLSVEILPYAQDISVLITTIEKLQGIQLFKIFS